MTGPGPAFVAEGPTIRQSLKLIERAVERRLPILLRGPSGTDKEMMSREAHHLSGRKDAFVPVNCAAQPESLIEAELCGHKGGAFTGARKGGSAGLVVEADGGTLFLDEIGGMRPALQTVLLRLLDDWQVRLPGGTKLREVNVQLVAATNVDLAQAVKAGRFRSDLFYRLSVADLLLPRLAERPDFALLLAVLAKEAAPGARIEEEAAAMLARHDWQSNMRELHNVLTRLALQGEDARIGLRI